MKKSLFFISMIFLLSAIYFTDELKTDSNIKLKSPEDNSSIQTITNFFNRWRKEKAEFKYKVRTSGEVLIRVYSISGRVVTTLVNTTQSPGEYTVQWDGMNFSGNEVSNGMYFIYFSLPDENRIKRVILMNK